MSQSNTNHHNKWFIKSNALPMCCASDGKEWPEATEAELVAWSGFCTFLEIKQPIMTSLEVPTSKLTQRQLADAVEHIRARGWNVQVDDGKLTISRPQN